MQLRSLRLLTKAYLFACQKHQYQRRKGILRIPYINHPIEVCNILTECNVNNVEILCGAVLHDTIEDTNTNGEEIEKQFGKNVRKYVEECTDEEILGDDNNNNNDNNNENNNDNNNNNNNQKNVLNNVVQMKKNQIIKANKISQQAKLIKIADKISNNQDLLIQGGMKNWTKQRVYGYHIWSQAVVTKMYGANIQLDTRMRHIFDRIGLSRLTQKQKDQQLEKYYQILQKECKQ